MTQIQSRNRLKPLLMACAAGAAMFASPAFAQQVDPNRLLDLMVQRGLVTAEEAAQLRAEASTNPPQQAQAPVPPGGVAADGTQTIPYVPQVVRDQIVEQVRTELGQQAQAEGWSRPGETPEWTRRITVSGDLRVRGDGLFLDRANYPDFVNWAAINAGPGFQVNEGAPGYVRPPYLNSNEDRRAARIRARLGITARIDDWITAEVRVATGNDNSPVSTNQSLGGNGEFGKYALWLDRANIRLTPIENVAIDVGRFGNPFWTSELLFDEDLNFDGVAVSGRALLGGSVSLFGAAGAFPIFNTDLNFSSRDAGAFSSRDKYLFAGQLGVEFRPSERIRARLAGAYYYFDGVQGEFSSPCPFIQDVCDTDATRPAFQQFGNTMFALRNIIPDPAAAPGASPEVQYFGLASKYELLNVRGLLEYSISDRLGVRLEGDYVRNLGFDRARVAPLALNNFAPVVGTTGGQYDGGDTGWQARLTAGHLDLSQPGAWNLHVGYRRLESDAVLDALADSDFGLGGTNAKGWFLGGAYAFGRNTTIGARWLSSDEVSGPPLSVNRLFIDLSTKF